MIGMQLLFIQDLFDQLKDYLLMEHMFTDTKVTLRILIT